MPRHVGIRMRRFWRMHRLKLAVACAGSALFAATFLTTDRTPGEGRLPVFETVPVPPPEPIAVTPGCHAESDGVTSSATRADLPPDGQPVVGGVQLPRGSRCELFWSTDAGVPDATAVADRLAAAFPRTGLWPILWHGGGEEPDAYFPSGGGAPGPMPPAERVLRATWAPNHRDGEPWPGLATAEVPAEPPSAPFAALPRDPAPTNTPGEYILMLVPVRRPADVFLALRPLFTEIHDNEELTSVLRSWEDRFGAVVAAVGPGALELAVGAPPSTREQAERLAAEHMAFAPQSDVALDVTTLGRALRSDRQVWAGSSTRSWAFGFPD